MRHGQNLERAVGPGRGDVRAELRGQVFGRQYGRHQTSRDFEGRRRDITGFGLEMEPDWGARAWKWDGGEGFPCPLRPYHGP